MQEIADRNKRTRSYTNKDNALNDEEPDEKIDSIRRRLVDVDVNYHIKLFQKNRKELSEYKSLFHYRNADFFKLDQGVYYCGEFKNGKIDGHGFMFCFNDKNDLTSVYKGNFNNGLADGMGTLIFDGGLGRYEGQWRNGRYDGLALYFQYYTENNTMIKYEGNWSDGFMHGNGKFNFPDGTSYSGKWVEGRRNGFGKYTKLDGTSMEGWWAND